MSTDQAGKHENLGTQKKGEIQASKPSDFKNLEHGLTIAICIVFDGHAINSGNSIIGIVRNANAPGGGRENYHPSNKPEPETRCLEGAEEVSKHPNGHGNWLNSSDLKVATQIVGTGTYLWNLQHYTCTCIKINKYTWIFFV